jgi:hypothetical protein
MSEQARGIIIHEEHEDHEKKNNTKNTKVGFADDTLIIRCVIGDADFRVLRGQ